MEDYNLRLDKEVFPKWKAELKEKEEVPLLDTNGEPIFTCDGIMWKNDVSKKELYNSWEKSNRRILFLLKDQPSETNDDTRFWLKDMQEDSEDKRKLKSKNRNLEIKFLCRIANLHWGLSKVNRDEEEQWWLPEIKMHFDKQKEFFNTQPFAFVECKKQPGSTKLATKVLGHHLHTYGHLLKKEIEILKPNIIVCTNSEIYATVRGMFPTDEIHEFEGHKSLCVHFNKKVKTTTVILCSYHPSAIDSEETNYEGVMYHYREFVKSKYFDYLKSLSE